MEKIKLQKVRVITNGVFHGNHFEQNRELLQEGDTIRYDFFFEGETHTVSKDQNGDLQIEINSPLICTSKEEFERKIAEGLAQADIGKVYTSEQVKKMLELDEE